MHNPRDAERYLVEAVSLRDDGVTYYQMGKFLSRENRYNDAIKYYSKALRSNKEENNIYTRCNCLCCYEYGFALYKLENLHFAKEMYWEALRIDKKINNGVSRLAPKKTLKLCKQIEKMLNENEENTDNGNVNFNFNINSSTNDNSNSNINNIGKFKSSKISQGNKNINMILDCEKSESVIDFYLFNEIDKMSNINVDINNDSDLFGDNGIGNDIEINTKNNFGAFLESNCNNLINSHVENSFEMTCQDIEKNYTQQEMKVDNLIKKNIQENTNNDNVRKDNYNHSHVDKICTNNCNNRLHDKNTTEPNKMQNKNKNKNKNKNVNEHNAKKHQVLKDIRPKQFQCVEEQKQEKENDEKRNLKQSDSGSNGSIGSIGSDVDHKSNININSNSNSSNNNGGKVVDEETKRADEFLIFWQHLPYFEPTKSKYFSKFVLNEWNCISMVDLITYDVLINDINMNPIHARLFQDGQSRVFDEKQTFLQWLNSFEFACQYQYIFERLGVYSFASFYRRFTNIDNFINTLKLPSNLDVVHDDCHEMWQNTPHYKRLQQIKKTKST